MAIDRYAAVSPVSPSSEADGAAMKDVPGPASSAALAGSARSGPVTIALMLLPGALVVFMGFNAGGYFPTTPAIAAIVLTQILLVRTLQAERPFAGMAPAALIAIGALTGYGALTLASALWSHALGRALIELDRVWLYLVALLLFATIPATSANLRWLIRGLAVGATVVCLAALISRVMPDVWHTAPDVANERLSYPVTYWNALGLLAALGVVLAAHLTCTLSERRWTRALAAAAVPLLGATLFFTFSRGAIAAGAIGLLAYVLVGRPRGLAGGLIAIAPISAALILIAYHANLLDTVDPTTPAAVSQGHRVALVAAVCAVAAGALRLLAAAYLDPRTARLANRRWMSPGARWATIAAVAFTTVAATVALGVPHTLAHDWHRFASGAQPPGEHSDLRQRLTDPSNNRRTDLWKVALQGFEDSPIHGHGAGMFQTVWDRRRPSYMYTVNAHSLYLQAMAELGVPGGALILALVLCAIAGLGWRARGSRRSQYAVLLGVTLAWALHAGVDWDWEMPVVTLPFFALAGLALSPRRAGADDWVPAHGTRIAIALACLAALALPALVIGSQRHLINAERSLHASSCPAAVRSALSSLDWLDSRAQPYEVLGFCDLQRGFPHMAVQAMRAAVQRDPGSWETYYALAIARGAAGMDPRGYAGRALRMNPYEPLVRAEVRRFHSASPLEWVNGADALSADALKSSRLSIASV